MDFPQDFCSNATVVLLLQQKKGLRRMKTPQAHFWDDYQIRSWRRPRRPGRYPNQRRLQCCCERRCPRRKRRRSVSCSWLPPRRTSPRSEEHTSELQSLMRISYAVFCLKKKKIEHVNKIAKQHNYILLKN